MAEPGPEDSLQQKPDEKPEILDSGRPRRAPPTIDLDASEVTSETRPATDPIAPEPAPEQASAAEGATADSIASEPEEPAPPASRPISPWVIAPLSGAVAAALVIGV